jgi:serine protease DegQ
MLPDNQQGGQGRDEALLVVGVTPDGPAAAAGVLVGDVLLDFDGHPTSSPEQLLAQLFGAGVGRQAPLKVLRGGKVAELTVTIGERPVH